MPESRSHAIKRVSPNYTMPPQWASVVTRTVIGAVVTLAEGQRRTMDAQMGESTLMALHLVIGDRRDVACIAMHQASTNPAGKHRRRYAETAHHPCHNSSFLHYITNYCWEAHHLCVVSRQPPRRPQPSFYSQHAISIPISAWDGLLKPTPYSPPDTISPNSPPPSAISPQGVKGRQESSQESSQAEPAGTWGTCPHQ